MWLDTRRYAGRVILLLASIGMVAAVGCDDPPRPQAPVSPGAGAGGGPNAGQAPRAPKPTVATPRLELTEADFIESASNRDPFRSFLAEFKTTTVRRTSVQLKVILPRYGLDELRLIAVVTGGSVRARAMFRDPTGLGVTVKRGDRISKTNARVKRILRDSVVMEVEERSEDTQQAAERVIELHPKEERDKEAQEAAGETATEPSTTTPEQQ